MRRNARQKAGRECRKSLLTRLTRWSNTHPYSTLAIGLVVFLCSTEYTHLLTIPPALFLEHAASRLLWGGVE